MVWVSLYPQLYYIGKSSNHFVQTIRMLWLFKQKRPLYFELTAGNELRFHKLLIGELASE